MASLKQFMLYSNLFSKLEKSCRKEVISLLQLTKNGSTAIFLQKNTNLRKRKTRFAGSLKDETFYNDFQTLWVHNQKMMQFFFHKEKLVHKTAFQSTLRTKSIKDSRNRAPCLLSQRIVEALVSNSGAPTTQ